MRDTDPTIIVAVIGALVTIGGWVALRAGTPKAHDADRIDARILAWADDLRETEEACRAELRKVRAELDVLRQSTSAEIEELRTEVARLRGGMGDGGTT